MNPVRNEFREEELDLEHKDGYITAIDEWMAGEITDISEALYLFAMDPADTPFQEGYRDALISLQRYGKPVHTPDGSNVTYVGFGFVRKYMWKN